MKAYSEDHLISGVSSYGSVLHDEEDGDSSLFLSISPGSDTMLSQMSLIVLFQTCFLILFDKNDIQMRSRDLTARENYWLC